MEEYHGSHNTNLTPTGLANKLIDEIMFLADMLLDLNQQRIIKSYCDIILQNRSAISDATNLLPLEAALLVIQATVHQNKNRESNDLRSEISTLRGEFEELKKLLNAKK